MTKRQVLAGVLLASNMIIATTALSGENAIVVESKAVCAGARGVPVHVRLTNVEEIRHVTVPLEIRSVTGGAFITSLKLSWSDRLPPDRNTPLSEFLATNQYQVKDCACSRGTKKGYAGTSSRDTLSHPVEISPVGALFARLRIVGRNLPAGSDSTGSMVMTVDIGKHAGTFEIDTACVCPANHIMFVSNSKPPQGIIPVFVKGVITVDSCKAEK